MPGTRWPRRMPTSTGIIHRPAVDAAAVEELKEKAKLTEVFGKNTHRTAPFNAHVIIQ